MLKEANFVLLVVYGYYWATTSISALCVECRYTMASEII